jgi:hypothetical protein
MELKAYTDWEGFTSVLKEEIFMMMLREFLKGVF